ncbi:cell division protein PerM [Nakamurella sp. GG22]
MIRQLAPERPTAVQPEVAGSSIGWVAGAAAVRGAAVALSGVTFAAGLSVLIWALTPASGADAGSALRAGVAGFAAANLIPVTIGSTVLTIPPLLFTLALAALLATTARRGRFLPIGRQHEALAVLVTAGVYGLLVATLTRGLGPEGVVPAGRVWTATVLALVATSGGMLARGSAWHGWWSSTVVRWVKVAARSAGIGVGVLIGGGGLALTAALVAHFGSAVAVSALAAPSWMDGLGLALLGVAYVPNAVIAATGYVTGVGFEIGPGTYSPFASSTVDLPALPLFAAAPDHAGRSVVGLAFLAVPVLAGYLMARPAIRGLATRSERVVAAGSGAVLAGVVLAALTAVARGRIGDGRWSTIGAPPLLVGAVVAVEVGVVAVAVASLTGGRSVPWRPDRPIAVLADADDDQGDLADDETLDDMAESDPGSSPDGDQDADRGDPEGTAANDVQDSTPVDTGLADAELDDTGLDDTGLDDTGLADAELDDTGLDDTGLDDTGLDDTGLDDTRHDDAAPDVTVLDQTGIAEAEPEAVDEPRAEVAVADHTADVPDHTADTAEHPVREQHTDPAEQQR